MLNRGRPAAGELHLADLAIFLSVMRLGSVSGAARALTVSSSQVSKAVARLERHLGLKLLVRSSRGVAVSDAGRDLAPRFEDLLARARGLRSLDPQPTSELTVAASAFVNALFLPLVVDCVPDHGVRSLEMPPGVAGAYASEPFFDLALTTGMEHWPESWVKVCVGTLRQGLFASPRLAAQLGAPKVSVARVRQEKFIVPIYNYRGQIMSGDDGCPLRRADRKIGHETQTLALALVVAQRTDQLVFAPVSAVSELVPPGVLVEIEVEGWDVHEPLYLVCHGERVSANVQQRIVSTLRAALAALADKLSARLS
jgi:DNA-binding transcriptional LysR family regulator